jgi:hypothetical protein
VSDAPLDSNVLRKVASLTLDKATIEQRVSKPKFVPEKLDFQIYEKFEGQSLYGIYFFNMYKQKVRRNVEETVFCDPYDSSESSILYGSQHGPLRRCGKF